MSSQDVVIEMVFIRLKAQAAVADVVFDARRQFQYIRADLADLCLQMHFVAEVVIVVAHAYSLVDIAEYGRVGEARKERHSLA